MRLFQKAVRILHHENVGSVYYRMGLAFPELAGLARPGQFVMVRLHDRSIPLLRRPFSIHRLLVQGGEVGGIELLYKVVGQGTKAMSKLGAGDTLDVLGPLGNGFTYPGDVRHAFVIAGGVGVASLYYLVLDLVKNRGVVPKVFLGGCSAVDILCKKEFESMGAMVLVSTEDCSLGDRGLVTELVEKVLETDERPDLIYACGPQAMLKAVGRIAAVHGVPCQVSLESAMACGFGVCLGCAVEKAGSPRAFWHVCTDGPVFDSKTVRM